MGILLSNYQWLPADRTMQSFNRDLKNIDTDNEFGGILVDLDEADKNATYLLDYRKIDKVKLLQLYYAVIAVMYAYFDKEYIEINNENFKTAFFYLTGLNNLKLNIEKRLEPSQKCQL